MMPETNLETRKRQAQETIDIVKEISDLLVRKSLSPGVEC